jgi:hypothetical protein
MTIRAYGVESALFRTAGLIDQAIGDAGHDPSAVTAALEEFAIEASLLKVSGSEMIDFVLDENVQIHGGNGFVKDYPAERHYRDARVNRIFEGTNEINRLLVPGMFVKRALKGGLPIIAAAKKLQDDLLSPAAAAPDSSDPLDNARRTVSAMKRTALMALGLAMQTYGESLAQEQEVLTLVSDILMHTFIGESAVLRALQNQRASDPTAALQIDAASVLVHDAAIACEGLARTALESITNGDTQRTMLAALRRILKIAPVNTIAVRRRLSDAAVEARGYLFR